MKCLNRNIRRRLCSVRLKLIFGCDGMDSAAQRFCGPARTPIYSGIALANATTNIRNGLEASWPLTTSQPRRVTTWHCRGGGRSSLERRLESQGHRPICGQERHQKVARWWGHVSRRCLTGFCIPVYRLQPNGR